MPTLIDVDQQPGHIDLGEFVPQVLNTFETFLIPDDTISPEVTLNEKQLRDGKVVVDQVVSWDVLFFESEFDAIDPELGTVRFGTNMGLVEDHSIIGDNPPTADIRSEHTAPGGAASGKSNYVYRMNHLNDLAAGAAGSTIQNTGPMLRYDWPGYVIDGVTWFKALTAGHYHFWTDWFSQSTIKNTSLGMEARRIDVDFVEALFNRQNILAQVTQNIIL